MGKRVIITLLKGNFDQGFPALLRIREDGAPPETEIQVEGHLPPHPKIADLYGYWKLAYGQLPGLRGHTSFPTEPSVTDQLPGLRGPFKAEPSVTNQLPGLRGRFKAETSETDLPCSQLAENFADSLKTWLNSGDREWQKIRDGLQQNLRRDDDIRAIIQTEDPKLRLLPWHLWDLFAQYYNKAEIAISSPQHTPSGTKTPSGNRVRILAILGDKKGTDSQTEINPQADLDLLKRHLRDADIVPLVEPHPEEFRTYLWDNRGWHILFFSGHSSSEISGQTGWIKINQNDSLTVQEFNNALRTAIENGLQLAIFNSCHGLGLANQIEELRIPQIIVMRERVLDRAAQDFLQHFLAAFSGGETRKCASLNSAVREARLKLEDTWNKDYPGTSWLPMICQNPAVEPLTWRGLLAWTCAHTISGHSDIIRTVAISPDGKTLATGSFDKTVKLWNLDTGELIDTIAGHSNPIRSVAFSPDGKTLASACTIVFQDGTIKLWDADTRRLRQTLGSSLLVLTVETLAFSPDGQILASGNFDHTINLWDLNTGKVRSTLNGHIKWPVESIAFSADGQILVSGGWDNTVKIWNWRREELLNTFNGPSPSDWAGFLVTWLNFPVGRVYSVAISPDGQTVASGGSDPPITLWDTGTGRRLRTLTEDSGTVYSVAFSPNGKILASGGEDSTVRIWNYRTGELLHTLKHLGPVPCVTFSPDGQTLVSGSADRTVKVWRVPY
ncbi:WD40 domain-containing protein [Kamptonema formosum]|uniref:WD40 domain-containing protein n=1 Tax=Kamptonema formosum TaxID=331992 RepID=UPI0003488A8F|nr:CHAT domain-containing protein [Oscillatoria sp. PCC 10802]